MKRGTLVGFAALLLPTVFACGGGATSPPVSPTPVNQTPVASAGTEYLGRLIDVMQAHSVNRLQIDWTSFRSTVLAAAPNAQSITDTHPAISVALGLLGDHHSFYVGATGTSIGSPNFPTGCSIAIVATPSVPSDIGYVRVESFAGATGGEAFAASIQQAIHDRDADSLAGWIVDLRGNGGGNMWPMLAGVGPVLGNGTAGYFVPPDGTSTTWGYDTRGSILGTAVQVAVASAYQLSRQNPRVAVLTDKRVASSGEAIAVAFRARPNTRSFGTETCGVPSANAGYTLSDGATLQLTVALDADRTLTTYDRPIPPDESLTDAAAVVQRAIDWVRHGS